MNKHKLLTEDTNNFTPPPSGLPLLCAMTLDEYDNYAELYSQDDMEFDPGCIVLTDEQVDDLKDDISKFVSDIWKYNENTYDPDEDDKSYDIYWANKYAIQDGDKYVIELDDGYYEGFYILVRKSYNDLSKDIQEKIKDFLDYLEWKYTLTKVSVSSASNGGQFISKQDSDYVDLDESKKITK